MTAHPAHSQFHLEAVFSIHNYLRMCQALVIMDTLDMAC